MFHRVVELDPMLRFGWVEPIGGLFPLQMNGLILLMHALEGSPTEPDSLKRFETILRRKGVNKDLQVLHACDNSFRIVVNIYVIAYYMHQAVGEWRTQLKKHFDGSDWPKSIQKATEYLKGPFQVLNMRAASAEIEAPVQ